MTQKQRILNQLKTKGYITRNQCLKNFISRLGARIKDLKNEGYIIEGKNIKTQYGEDYIYYLVDNFSETPQKPFI
jgi:hypothetical protein